MSDAPSRTNPPSPVRLQPVVDRCSLWFTVGIALLSALFWFSVLAKLQDLRGFELILRQQHIVSGRDAAQLLSRALVALELFIAAGLWLPWRRTRVILPITAFLLAGFSLYFFILAGRSDLENCGCFGTAVELSPLAAALKNLPFIAIALALIGRGPVERGGSAWPLLLLCLSIALGTVLGLPLRAGVQVQPDADTSDGDAVTVDTAAAVVRPSPVSQDTDSPFAGFGPYQPEPFDALHGLRYIAFVSLDCEHCQALIRDLADQVDALPAPVGLVCLGEAGALVEFRSRTGADFPATLADPLAFFDSIGDAPPRLYLVRDGQPLRFWEGEEIDLAQVLAESMDAITN